MPDNKNEIIIDVYTHVIVTHKDGHYFITEDQNKSLSQLALDGLYELDDGSKIKGSSIAEVMPLEKYYQQFPEKKPAPEERKRSNFIDFKAIHNKHLEKIKSWTRDQMISKHKQLIDYIRDQTEKKIDVSYAVRCLETDLSREIKFQKPD